MALEAMPLTRDQANAHIRAHHRHHGPVSGHRFIVGATRKGELVGVAVAGRPRARLIDQYRHVEVNRLCSDGAPNVCSFLYSRCARIAREQGFTSIFTAILESESGTSLKAAGWYYAYTTRGGSQDRPSRRRVDKSPTEPKQIWAPAWCLEVVRGLNKEARTTCQVCGTHSKTTGQRSVPNPTFSGSCGDSFCWHTCDIADCKERYFTVFACNVCAKKLEKQTSAQRQSSAGEKR